MKRPPRGPKDRLFSFQSVGYAVFQGVSVLAVCLGVFLLSRQSHTPEAARALTFGSLVAAVVVVILANRSSSRTILGGLRVPNPVLWWVVGGAIALLPLVLLVPFAQRLFHFAPIGVSDLAYSVAAGLACAIWFDLVTLGKGRVRTRLAQGNATTA